MTQPQSRLSSPVHALTFPEMTPIAWRLQLVCKLIIELFSDAFQTLRHGLDLDQPECQHIISILYRGIVEFDIHHALCTTASPRIPAAT